MKMASAMYISGLQHGCSRTTVTTGKERKKVNLLSVIKNKGTLPCDFCGKWKILKSIDNKYVLCEECRKNYDQLKPIKHERIELDFNSNGDKDVSANGNSII